MYQLPAKRIDFQYLDTEIVTTTCQENKTSCRDDQNRPFYKKVSQFHFCPGDTGASAGLPPGGRSNTLQTLRKNPAAVSDTATFFCHGSIRPPGNGAPDALNTQAGSFWRHSGPHSSSQVISDPDRFGIWRPAASPTPPPPLCKAP